MTRDVYNQNGLSGASYVGASETFSGDGAGIHVLSATVLAGAVSADGVNIAGLLGPTIGAGAFIPGRFTEVSVSSGLIAIPNLKSGNTVA